jgi:hypothetical protein
MTFRPNGIDPRAAPAMAALAGSGETELLQLPVEKLKDCVYLQAEDGSGRIAPVMAAVAHKARRSSAVQVAERQRGHFAGGAAEVSAEGDVGPGGATAALAAFGALPVPCLRDRPL